MKEGGAVLRTLIFACGMLASSIAFGADESITTSGCVSGGVEGCLFLASPKGNYALYIKAPRPSPGRGVTVTGTISNGPNICMTGPGIVVTKWEYNQLQCAK